MPSPSEITEGTNPYSKSHNRRVKRAAQPSQHLVSDLSTVEDVLSEMKDVEVEPEMDSDDARRTAGAVKENVTGGKGKEKLTAKKRQRVLYVCLADRSAP